VSAEPFARLLRFYPPAWRDRYGGEMTALLEDTYATASEVPWRQRAGLVRAGLAERARAAGLVGGAEGPEARLRAGSVLVLCGWALFLVAGAIFGKFTDNWFNQTPSLHRTTASVGYNAVVVLGALGCAVVAIGALVVLPSFARFVRNGQWHTVSRAVRRAVVALGVAALLIGGGLVWAHHLSGHDRHGGLFVYGLAFVVISLAACGAIGYATAAAVAVGRRIELSPRAGRVVGVLSLALVAVMALLAAGVVLWWVTEARYAPAVLRDGIGNGVLWLSSTVPPSLLVAGLCMVLGLALALPGSARVARSLAAPPAG
jgi:hypothetical protein